MRDDCKQRSPHDYETTVGAYHVRRVVAEKKLSEVVASWSRKL